MFFSDVGMVLWLSQPLIYANMLPVLTGRHGQPIDGYHRAWDGQPWLGPGKTWSGLLGGIVLAVLGTGVINGIVVHSGGADLGRVWGQTSTSAIFHMITLASGALLGDLLKSFIKRRQHIDRGRAWPILDQMDAVVGGFGLTWLTDPRWFIANFLPGRWLAVAALLVVYLLLHQGVSRLAYGLGWKTQPN